MTISSTPTIFWNGTVGQLMMMRECLIAIDTVEKFRVLEVLDANTSVKYNIHKRVWPSAQRDACYVSHRGKHDKKYVPILQIEQHAAIELTRVGILA